MIELAGSRRLASNELIRHVSIGLEFRLTNVSRTLKGSKTIPMKILQMVPMTMRNVSRLEMKSFFQTN